MLREITIERGFLFFNFVGSFLGSRSLCFSKSSSVSRICHFCQFILGSDRVLLLRQYLLEVTTIYESRHRPIFYYDGSSV